MEHEELKDTSSNVEYSYFQQPAESIDVEAQKYDYKLCLTVVQLVDCYLPATNTAEYRCRPTRANTGLWLNMG